MSDTAAEAALLAKQALKDMALAQAAPTPENFQFHYELARSRLTGRAPPERQSPKPVAAPAPAPSAEPEGLIGALAIIEAFLANLSDLYPDNPSLREQVEILRDVLASPGDPARVRAAKKTLERARAPQLRTSLSAAKALARDMSERFLNQMGDAEQATGRLADELEEQEALARKASSPEQVALALEAMGGKAREARVSLAQARREMIETRSRAEEALASVRHLEARLVKASEEAKRDYLTGLLNRRGLDEELARAFAHALPPTLALLDIDNFKAINDASGHEGGDQALKALSQAIRDILDGQGSPARMGGEEFLIVFPELGALAAKSAVQGLQRALTTKLYMEAAGERLITFSAGVAQRVEGETPAETIARADEAMYAAKRLGKNRVEISPKNLPERPEADPPPTAHGAAPGEGA